jgi:hypothetical protein
MNLPQDASAKRKRSQAAFLPALIRAHLARWAAAIFRFAAADITRFGRTATGLPFSFARRAFWAALIFLRAAAE